MQTCLGLWRKGTHTYVGGLQATCPLALNPRCACDCCPHHLLQSADVLGLSCAAVQDSNGVRVMLAEPDFPRTAGLHAVVVQHADHYSTLAALATPSTWSPPPLTPACSMHSTTPPDPTTQYLLVGASPALDAAPTRLHALFNARLPPAAPFPMV